MLPTVLILFNPLERPRRSYNSKAYFSNEKTEPQWNRVTDENMQWRRGICRTSELATRSAASCILRFLIPNSNSSVNDS